MTFSLLRPLFGILCLLCCLPLNGQVIGAEQLFPVEGYSVFQKGYPLHVVSGGQGRFAYLEYWAEGKQGRRTANYYLQVYSARDYVEHWYKPVTDEGMEPMIVTDLYRLKHSYAVIGKQYRVEGGKDMQTAARFFDHEGKPRGAEPALLSTFTKKSKSQREWLEVSPRNEVILWVGVDGKECEMTLWGSYGGNRWEKFVELPYLKEKYELLSVKVNDKGEPFLLLHNPKTVEAPLVLAKYLPEEERFVTTLLNRDPSMVLGLIEMGLTEAGDVFVTGTYAQTGSSGLINGTKVASKEPQTWTHLFFQSLMESKEEWTVQADSLYTIPEQWLAFFAGGSNFADAKMVVKKDFVSLVLEEQYSDRQKIYYYNLGVLGYNLKTGKLLWSDIVEKKQRDQRSAHFLSYVPGVASDKLRLVYLTERGARGKLVCTSFDMANGKRKDKTLAGNEGAEYLFFPGNSGMVSANDMVLVGMGNPSQNNYKLITIKF